MFDDAVVRVTPAYEAARGKVTRALPSEVAQLIHPHPTMSEAVGEAHLALAGKPLHSHS